LFILALSPVPGTGQVAADPVTVEFFSPQGTARHVRQVVVRFSSPMVALGDPRLEAPMNVQCPAAGKGRWADGRNWVYDFDADLPAGLRCVFTPRLGLSALNGRRLADSRSYSFDTGGPTIEASLPQDGWEELDAIQAFILKLDAPATESSILGHAYCLVDGVSEKIPVRVFSGAERQAVLDQRKELGYDYLQLFWKNGATTDVRIRDRRFEEADKLITVLVCQRSLPPATKVYLKWGAGIETVSGIATRDEQQLAFRVRPAFTAQVECTRANARAGCIPSLPITVQFSAPVPREQALAIRLKTAHGGLLVPAAVDEGNVPVVTGVKFAPPFAERESATVILPPTLVDDANRPLENAARFPLAVRVDAYPPLAKFSGTFGILEAREGGVLPVTLRNLELKLPAQQSALLARSVKLQGDPGTISKWLQRVAAAQQPSGDWIEEDSPGVPGKKAGGDDEDDGGPHRVWKETTGTHSVFTAGDTGTRFTLANPARGRTAEVVGIPLRNPGFYVVEIESRILGASLLGRDEVRYVATSALVTDLAVHFKWGRESSRVWVTRLSDGSPVARADVVVADYCTGASKWQGTTDADGIAAIATSLGAPHGQGGCTDYSPHPLMVVARTDADFSFTQSGWSEGITPYEFSLPVGDSRSTQIAHTVMDRTLFRAGETVSMQHFLRFHYLNGIAVPAGAPGRHKIVIEHQGSGQHYDFEVPFGADGVAESQWKIPAEAKLGSYVISIDQRQSGGFKVEQFRLPSMRASISGPARPLVRPARVELDLHVAYLSGGGASGLATKVRAVVEPLVRQHPDYPDYQFGGAAVKEGLVTETPGGADDDTGNESGAPLDKTRVLPVTLDVTGSARVTVPDLPPVEASSQLVTELEYPDANGELMTATGRVRLEPAALSVGIRTDGWVSSKDQTRFRVVVLDLDGKPRARQQVTVSLYQSTFYSYRKRLIGGFYAYETNTETRKLKAACAGQTDEHGLLYCEVAPGETGQILIRAETRDGQGQLAGATATAWVAGGGDWWFGGTSGDRMDLLPEKKEYEAGDRARLQVRMPFRSATALVTVEREGVLQSFVTHLNGNTPVIEVPIEDRYAPNVFVSVLAARGRVAHSEHSRTRADRKAEITALVDLNKPAYRLGVAQIRVGWRPHRLDVRVSPAQKIYKVRDHAEVRVHVARADGRPLPAGTQIALAAVDEALLDLAANTSWNLLESMMGERGLEVWTSTAQMQVVGKRHYGRKAVPHGGGGGRGLGRGRELFNSLLAWMPQVPLDANGDAMVSVPLNDSLSSFRIVAIAHGGADLFGTGSASINTSQDLILVSGLPPLLRSGDHFSATFTVRNTTDHVMRARVQAALTPPAGPVPEAREVEVPGGQSRDVVWQVTVPQNASQLAWDVTARDVAGAAGDHLKVKESVSPAYPVRTYQATIAQLTGPLSVPVARPAGALAGRGGLTVTLRARLGDGLDGVREYMQRYPYICLEQQLSQAIALRDRGRWTALMDRLPAYLDRDGLLRYFPGDQAAGDDTLTSYVLSIASEAGWPLNDTDRTQMLRGLTRFVEGQIVRRSALETADLTIRRLAAIAALSYYHEAQPGMLDSITVEPNLWPTSALLDWIDILRRVDAVPDRDRRLHEALGILRSRLNFQGSTLGFAGERTDALWWLMISADSNANRVLLTVLDLPQWREDVPRLVTGVLGRQQAGHWNTTVANAWGVLAMERFSTRFETTPVSGSSTVTYGAASKTVSWATAHGPSQVIERWRDAPSTLGVTHSGAGAPWAIVQASAALPLRQPLSSGFRIKRSLIPVDQRQPGVWSRGDVVRVHLELEAQSDMSWVVVDDPIPAGATILGSGLNGQSGLLARDDHRTGWAWLAYEERRFDGFRAYYRFVPKGHWTVEYTVRLNNPGTFLLPPSRVEAMYAPEMLGEQPNAPLVVKPAT